MEYRLLLHLSVITIGNGAFGSLSTQVANFTSMYIYTYIYIYIYIYTPMYGYITFIYVKYIIYMYIYALIYKYL